MDPETARQVRATRGDDVPASALARLTGGPYDDVDHHEIDLTDPPAGSAEQWARAMFEDARPRLTRLRDLGLLGLLLTPPGPQGSIGGWRTVEVSPSALAMGSTSALMTDQLRVRLSGTTVALTTAVRFASPLARPVWTILSTQHRRLAPRLLRRAATSLRPLPGRPVGGRD